MKTEHNTSFEASAEYTFHVGPIFSEEKGAPDVFYKGTAAGSLVLGATAFSNNLKDSVGAVTLMRDTTEFPIFTHFRRAT